MRVPFTDVPFSTEPGVYIYVPIYAFRFKNEANSMHRIAVEASINDASNSSSSRARPIRILAAAAFISVDLLARALVSVSGEEGSRKMRERGFFASKSLPRSPFTSCSLERGPYQTSGGIKDTLKLLGTGKNAALKLMERC